MVCDGHTDEAEVATMFIYSGPPYAQEYVARPPIDAWNQDSTESYIYLMKML